LALALSVMQNGSQYGRLTKMQMGNPYWPNNLASHRNNFHEAAMVVPFDIDARQA